MSEEITNATAGLRSFRRETAHGTFATLESTAPADAPLLVLLHSTGTSKRMFNQVIPALPHLRCVAVDVLGHGESDRPGHEFTIPDHASAIADLITQLRRQDEPVLLAGCSLGAIIAVELAATTPGLLDGLLLNGCPGWHLESQRTGRLRTLSTKLLGSDGLPLPDAEMPGTVVLASAEEHKARQADVAACGRWLLSTQWAVAAYDIAARLPKVRTTTTVLIGEHDFLLLTMYTIVEGITDARLEFLDDASHLSPYDNPEGFAASVRRLETRALVSPGRSN